MGTPSEPDEQNNTADDAATKASAVERAHAALTRDDARTVVELATVLGLGRSTVGKALVALESAGRAERGRGGRVRTHRTADVWRPSATECPPRTEQATDTNGTAGIGEAMRATVPAAVSGKTTPVSTVAATSAGTSEDPAADDHASRRLARGALRSLVAEFLAAHPGEAFTASRISRDLGRSAGAVANALAVLAGEDTSPVVQVEDSPRRYAHQESA
jgi:DNA-binding transcriptional ArsR family regulator